MAGMAKQCTKVRYKSVKQALAAKYVLRRKKIPLVAYYCQKCGFWHLGNTYGTRQQRLDMIFAGLPASDRAGTG